MYSCLYDGSRAVAQGLDRLLPNGDCGTAPCLQVRQGTQVQLAISMRSGKDAQALTHHQAPVDSGCHEHRAEDADK